MLERLLRAVLVAATPSVAACVQLGPGDPNHGHWGERVVADVGVMPAFWLTVDSDDEDVPTVDLFGPGAGVRLGIGNADQSVGLLYQTAFLDEDDGPAEIDVHVLLLDFDVSVPVEPQGFLLVHAAAGLGMVSLESPDPALDTTTGAANLRLQLELRPMRRLAFLAGVGAFAFGSAGDTEAYGTFIDLGMRLTF
ncbi:MAG TPA: hypothetical protein VK081_07980 [Planctomycetota bacterium]|nr:hypothetical protein [Planctomycetota bacterium]